MQDNRSGPKPGSAAASGNEGEGGNGAGNAEDLELNGLPPQLVASDVSSSAKLLLREQGPTPTPSSKTTADSAPQVQPTPDSSQPSDDKTADGISSPAQSADTRAKGVSQPNGIPHVVSPPTVKQRIVTETPEPVPAKAENADVAAPGGHEFIEEAPADVSEPQLPYTWFQVWVYLL